MYFHPCKRECLPRRGIDIRTEQHSKQPAQGDRVVLDRESGAESTEEDPCDEIDSEPEQMLKSPTEEAFLIILQTRPEVTVTPGITG